MSLRCVYTDLDGTLLGKDGSLFHDADGKFTLLAARALEACARAGAEVVIKSGRRKETVAANARLLGQTSYIYEVGAGMVIDGEETLLTGDLKPADGKTIYEQIEEAGAPALLFEHFGPRLEYHEPWHRGRDISHLMRGTIDVREANELLEQNGLGHLRLVDNGAIAPRARTRRWPPWSAASSSWRTPRMESAARTSAAPSAATARVSTKPSSKRLKTGSDPVLRLCSPFRARSLRRRSRAS
jgi:hypothetical protein